MDPLIKQKTTPNIVPPSTVTGNISSGAGVPISSSNNFSGQHLSRKDFLVRSGGALLAVVGIGSIIELLSGQHHQNAKDTAYQLTSQKNQPSGYAGLDDSGKLPQFILPLLPTNTTTTPNLSSISKLTDVSITNPSSGQVLTYNTTTGKWTNQSLPTDSDTPDNDTPDSDTTDNDAPDSDTTSTGNTALVTSVAGKTGAVTLDESDISNLVTDLASKAPINRNIYPGTGLSGGGDLTADRTLSILYGTAAGTAAVGNDSRIVNAVQTSRNISSGSGLTGGGDLTVDRTLSVLYGTTAGTAAAGNDGRITNAVQAANNGSDFADAGSTRANLHVPVLSSCQAVLSSNVSLSSPGTGPFDGYTPASGDQLLMTSQTTTSQNGPWVYNGSAAAMTRPTDYASGASIGGRSVQINAGTTNGGSIWVMTTTSPITVDTTATTWALAKATVASGIFAPASLPLGISGAGRYDPILNVYTPPSYGGIPKTQAKFAQVDVAVNRSKIACIGASTVAGWNGTISLRGFGSWPDRLNNVIADMSYPASEPVFTFCDDVANDTRCTITGTWTYSTDPSSTVVVAGFAGATLTAVCTRAGDTVEVAVSGNSGVLNVLIDGVSPTSGVTVVHGTYTSGDITPDGSSNYTKATFSSLTKAAHTIKITCISAIAMGWIDSYLSDSVSIANFGSSGTSDAHWNDTSVYYTLLESAINWGPDIVILGTDVQFNGWQGYSESFATSLTNLESIVSILQAAGIEVILNGITPVISPFIGTPPIGFWQNLYALSDATGCMLIDQFTPSGSSEVVAAANGLIGGADTVHPSAAGYAGIARRILRAIA